MKKLLLLLSIIFVGQIHGQVCFNSATNYAVDGDGNIDIVH
jgi:hypothetical protein